MGHHHSGGYHGRSHGHYGGHGGGGHYGSHGGHGHRRRTHGGHRRSHGGHNARYGHADGGYYGGHGGNAAMIGHSTTRHHGGGHGVYDGEHGAMAHTTPAYEQRPHVHYEKPKKKAKGGCGSSKSKNVNTTKATQARQSALPQATVVDYPMVVQAEPVMAAPAKPMHHHEMPDMVARPIPSAPPASAVPSYPEGKLM